MIISNLQAARLSYQPALPEVFRSGGARVKIVAGDLTRSVGDEKEIQKLFPHTFGEPMITFGQAEIERQYPAIKVGVVLSGGQAPGGHNVIAGLYDGLKSLNPENQVIGFLGGPKGLMDNRALVLTDAIVDAYRNTGGFDMICSGRDKIESNEQVGMALKTAQTLGLKGIVVIGGDDSNTNACVLAEKFLECGADIQVIGCPKTIDGDLKNASIEVSFGFDTACRVYSELIGNIARDANSAQKYWHFIRLMGRSASHIALECALQTRPNIAIMSEEVAEKALTLEQIATQVADVVQARAENGKRFGICLIPEGLIEFIPEMKALIGCINRVLHATPEAAEVLRESDDPSAWEAAGLSADLLRAFESIPKAIREQLLEDRDAHGNVQVSRIETEKLLIMKVKQILKDRGATFKFGALSHFFGYEGRCVAPSNFDANYCYSLGYTASALVGHGITGYIASVSNLTASADQWVAGGVPLTAMMNIEWRHEQHKPVIRKALVELDGAPFKALDANREKWAQTDCYVFPGPIQYYGPAEVCDVPSWTLRLEAGQEYPAS